MRDGSSLDDDAGNRQTPPAVGKSRGTRVLQSALIIGLAAQAYRSTGHRVVTIQARSITNKQSRQGNNSSRRFMRRVERAGLLSRPSCTRIRRIRGINYISELSYSMRGRRSTLLKRYIHSSHSHLFYLVCVTSSPSFNALDLSIRGQFPTSESDFGMMVRRLLHRQTTHRQILTIFVSFLAHASGVTPQISLIIGSAASSPVYQPPYCCNIFIIVTFRKLCFFLYLSPPSHISSLCILAIQC